MAITAGLTPPMHSYSDDSRRLAQFTMDQLPRANAQPHLLSLNDGHLHFVSGVGKPAVKLSYIELLRLWHARLGHPPLRTLLGLLKRWCAGCDLEGLMRTT